MDKWLLRTYSRDVIKNINKLNLGDKLVLELSWTKDVFDYVYTNPDSFENSVFHLKTLRVHTTVSITFLSTLKHKKPLSPYTVHVLNVRRCDVRNFHLPFFYFPAL